jgi:hypothetical protein
MHPIGDNIERQQYPIEPHVADCGHPNSTVGLMTDC